MKVLLGFSFGLSLIGLSFMASAPTIYWINIGAWLVLCGVVGGVLYIICWKEGK